eukprot:scaffold40413_cov42-Phaeocystis_antarctica.AAC.1
MGGSPRASRRRARAIWTLVCARALSGGARALGSSVAAPDDARSTRRAAGVPPVTLGCAPVARGASACAHSSSDPAAPARDQRLRPSYRGPSLSGLHSLLRASGRSAAWRAGWRRSQGRDKLRPSYLSAARGARTQRPGMDPPGRSVALCGVRQ